MFYFRIYLYFYYINLFNVLRVSLYKGFYLLSFLFIIIKVKGIKENKNNKNKLINTFKALLINIINTLINNIITELI